jgi:hypothetical protein
MTIYDHEPDCTCDACIAHNKEQSKLAARRDVSAEKKKTREMCATTPLLHREQCEQASEQYTVTIDQEGTVTIDAQPFSMIFPKNEFDDIILKVQQSRQHTPAPDTIGRKQCEHWFGRVGDSVIMCHKPYSETEVAHAATLAAYEDLWKFCLVNGVEKPSDLFRLSRDPFFPLKLLKYIAEKRVESLRNSQEPPK